MFNKLLSLYGGIKKGYPHIARVSRAIAVFLQLVRPYTLLAPLIAGYFGLLIPIAYFGQYHIGYALEKPLLFITVILLLMGVQAIGQMVNQLYDVEIDKINKPYRPLPAGKVKPETVKKLSIAIITIYIVLLVVASIVFGNIWTFIFGLLGLFLAVYYSVEPIRMKKRHWILSNLWQAFARGFLPFWFTWFFISQQVNIFLIVLSITGFLWVFAFQGTKDINDYEGDFKFKIPTIVVRQGAYGAYTIMSSLGTITVLFSIVLWYFRQQLAFLTITLAILVIIIDMLIARAISIGEEFERIENNSAWILFYAGLGLIYIITFIALVI